MARRRNINAGFTAEYKRDLAEKEETARFCKEAMTALNEARGRENITKTEFAEKLGVAPSSYYLWNQGKLSKVSLDTLCRVLNRCGKTLAVVDMK